LKKQIIKALPSSNKEIKKQFSHLIGTEEIRPEIPDEHRHKGNPNTLRCFKMIYRRDSEGKKLIEKPRKRCARMAVKGYLYCQFHGGKLSDYQVQKSTGKIISHTAIKEYKGIYDDTMGSVLERFISDPDILDLKPDLANLKTILYNYIKELSKEKTDETKLVSVNRIENVILDGTIGVYTKYDKIEQIILAQQKLTNGGHVDRINRCVKSISDVVKIIHSVETNKNFSLTPAGFKRFIRTLVDIHKQVITNEEDLTKLRALLMAQSIETTAKSDNTSEEQ
jgi:hypothetical protein